MHSARLPTQEHVFLHEAGLIKSSPQKILAQGTDWRFLNDLKR